MRKKLEELYDKLLQLTDWIRNHRLKAFLIIFVLGMLMRFLVLTYYFSVVYVDWNDMNEKVWLAILNLISGINPYGQEYTMEVLNLVGGNANTEPWFQYPPLALLIHLPALIWPGPSSIGVMDFMPAFMLIHLIMDFYMYYRLYKAGYHWSAAAIWTLAGALFIALDFITFISVPLMFLILAYLNMDKSFKSALYIGLGVATYTYLALPALFFLIYHFKKSKWKGLIKFIVGLIPAVLIILPFLLWDPSIFVHDILLSQSARNTAGNFLFPKYGSDWWWLHLYSITPYINSLYNIIVDPSQPLYIENLTTVLTGLAFLFCIYYLYKFYKKPYRGKLVYWSCLALLAVTIVSAAGFFYYLLLPIIILIFLIDLRKEITVEEYTEDYILPIEKHYKKQDKG
ncbi:MAG: hypothetical protein EU551_00665 [Promethearchaeota archaeon]|nr:MAG: hypothetical protein EU551_00665 [Candidatus Lokiarchaeota archaeon]